MLQTIDKLQQAKKDLLMVAHFFESAKESIAEQITMRESASGVSVKIEPWKKDLDLNFPTHETLANKTHQILKLSEAKNESEINWGPNLFVWLAFLKWSFERGLIASLTPENSASKNFVIRVNSIH